MNTHDALMKVWNLVDRKQTELYFEDKLEESMELREARDTVSTVSHTLLRIQRILDHGDLLNPLEAIREEMKNLEVK